VIEAVRVPPSASITSQSIRIWRSPQRLEIRHRAQRPADQSLDLVRAPAGMPAVHLALDPFRRGAGQHAVLGRHPSAAAVSQKRRHALLHRGGAEHFRAAHLDQGGALGFFR